MRLEQSKGVREKGKEDRKFSSTCGTRTHDLLLSGQAHYHCAKGEAASGELVKLFSVYGYPQILHSDQGRNFESSILAQTLKAFGVKKSRTTAYHPQGHCMVECFNRSLLQLLRTYVDLQSDWERYLLLGLYAYRPSSYSSMAVSPFLSMYGRNPSLSSFSLQNAFDSLSNPAHLQAKLAELQDFVETKMAATAHNQKHSYDQHTLIPAYAVGDLVWLSVPKLDPRWEGGWVVKAVKSPISIEIMNNRTNKIVHTNRLQHRIVSHDEVPKLAQSNTNNTIQQWANPTIYHMCIPPPAPIAPWRYPQRNHTAPERYGY